MAEAVLTKKVLVISYKIGDDEDGEDVIKNERYSNINVGAPEENLIALATAISSLKEYPVTRLYLEEEKTLLA